MEFKFVLNETQIDSIDKLDLSHLAFEDIYAHYGTGRAITKGTGRDKTYTYRHGIGTNVGDIEETVWCEVVKRLIIRANEQTLFRCVKEWTKENNRLWRNMKELEIEALKLHARRIFDDSDWCDYIAFNKKYRPEILKPEGSL